MLYLDGHVLINIRGGPIFCRRYQRATPRLRPPLHQADAISNLL